MTVISNRSTASLDIVSFYLYLIEGAILMFVNGYMGSVVFMSKRLRNQKEYVLIGSNMLFDAYFGFSWLMCGVYSLNLYYNNEYLPLYSKWECFILYQTLIFTISAPSVGWISFFTCIDRLVSIVFPVKYMKLPAKFAYLTPILAALFTMPIVVLFGITSYWYKDDLYTEPALCDLENTGSTDVYQAYRGTRIACSLSCVLIYIPIAFKSYKVSYQS
uniref:G-protein coupled receptors family 1 profile domain-containing protein n=1 Tax=Acrobeloides nanus TaxID=290746 RepID=A0A914EBV6_9BILA